MNDKEKDQDCVDAVLRAAREWNSAVARNDGFLQARVHVSALILAVDLERRRGKEAVEAERRLAAAAKADPRPSWRCSDPDCKSRPSQDGECWLCPTCRDALKKKLEESQQLCKELEEEIIGYMNKYFEEHSPLKKEEIVRTGLFVDYVISEMQKKYGEKASE